MFFGLILVHVLADIHSFGRTALYGASGEYGNLRRISLVASISSSSPSEDVV
jgi:hypothetical protein